MNLIGMDFGTTNSGLAVFDRQVRLLPVDAANPLSPHVLRTTLYVTREHECFIGREAIEEHIRRNEGRPIRLRQEYIGTLSLTYADLGTFARDAYVWVDELEPGRLFRSIKSSLQDDSYLGTAVWGQYYRLEDLVALFLRRAKERAEAVLGHEVDEIVLGRPVKFADKPQGESLAEERLARAAILAGYRQAYFELEPVAAALSYVQARQVPQRILVFDFGGGTLDIAVMAVDLAGRQDVLATGGVRIAGDVFDQRIVRARLAPYLGQGSTYGPKSLSMPAYIYEDLCDWQSLLLLNRPEVIEFLAEVECTTTRPEPIRALSSLIRNNYGLTMFDQVERAKIALSSERETILRLSGKEIAIEDPFSRSEFQRLIRKEAHVIARCVDETLAAAGLRPAEIDVVVRTGGSSLIPLFQRMLAMRFEPEKVMPVDEFSSVTAGLAIAAHLLSQGQRELPSYSTEILTTGQLLAQPELKKESPDE